MTREKKVLISIIQEFPLLSGEITELFTESTSFIETCEDYMLCLNSIKKMAALEDPVHQQEIEKLKLMQSELKEELLFRIMKMYKK